MNSFSAEIIDCKKIDSKTLQSMHHLYLEYYNGVPFEQFSSDIKKSTACAVVKDNKTNAIVAFTAFSILQLPYENKNIIVFCGGKTLSDRNYWGTKVTHILQTTWLKTLIVEYLKNINKPYYVYFAPTGYKTFLLLVNNFLEYWPSPYKNDVRLERLADLISKKLYGTEYNLDTKLVNFHEHYALKEDVAPITEEHIKNNPKIALFSRLNPTWIRGTGLPTIARINIKSLAYLSAKKALKALKHTSKSKGDNNVNLSE